jgi:hypothetical protein
MIPPSDGEKYDKNNVRAGKKDEKKEKDREK